MRLPIARFAAAARSRRSDAARRGLAVRRRRPLGCRPLARADRPARRTLCGGHALDHAPSAARRALRRGGRAGARGGRRLACPVAAASFGARARRLRGDRGATGSGSGGGTGRQIVRILPRCCTGAASRPSQIRGQQRLAFASIVAEHADLDQLCARRLTSISCSTAGVSPWWPMVTTGWSGCALAR